MVYFQNRDHDLASLLHLTRPTPDSRASTIPWPRSATMANGLGGLPTSAFAPHYSSLWSATISHTGFLAISNIRQILSQTGLLPGKPAEAGASPPSSMLHVTTGETPPMTQLSKVCLPNFPITAPLPLHYLQF